jgi:hypothetical protein
MVQQLESLLNSLGSTQPGSGQAIGAVPFTVLMLVSLAASLAIAYLYVAFYANRATGSQVHRAFPLLGMSITAIFICIQFSLPLSLGLLGALSIVRFRTPIKEPEEIGFIMLLIATSIATATFQLLFVGVLFVVATGALLIQRGARLLHGPATDGAIVVSLPRQAGESGAPAAVTALVRRHAPKARLESVAQVGEDTVLSYGVSRIGDDALLNLPDDVRSSIDGATCNVFFARPNAL